MPHEVPWRRWTINCLVASVLLASSGCGGGGAGLAPAPSVPRSASLIATAVATPVPANALVSIMSRVLKGVAYEGQYLYAFKNATYGGAVTIGSGHLVANEAAFTALPLRKANSVVATDIEKHLTWLRLSAAAPGHPASYYQQFTELFLTPAATDALLNADIQNHINRVVTRLPHLLTLPIGFQVALADIDSTVPGGIAAYPRLLAAPDAVTAYRESHRTGVSDVRNQQIMSLFLAAGQHLPASTTNPDISTRALSLGITGAGTVRVQPDSVYPGLSTPARRVYTHGMAIRLTAVPSTGQRFAGWSGGATGSSLTTEVVLDTDKTVTAQFASGMAPSPTPPPQLVIQDLRPGTGAAAQVGQTLTVNYLGTFLNGVVFDNSYDRGQPFQFRLGAHQVIAGWDQGLIGMKVGGKRKLIVPADLAYGPGGSPPTIPPNTPLLFEVELLAVKSG